jgi:hypothetical protein
MPYLCPVRFDLRAIHQEASQRNAIPHEGEMMSAHYDASEVDNPDADAHFVGVTIFGTDAFMCATCVNFNGMGLGLGKGQILVMGA